MAVFRCLVKDVEAEITFYTQHLGFQLEQKWGQLLPRFREETLLFG